MKSLVPEAEFILNLYPSDDTDMSLEDRAYWLALVLVVVGLSMGGLAVLLSVLPLDLAAIFSSLGPLSVLPLEIENQHEESRWNLEALAFLGLFFLVVVVGIAVHTFGIVRRRVKYTVIN